MRYATCTEFIGTLEKRAIQDAPAEALTETLTLGIEPLKPDPVRRSWVLAAAATVLPVVALAFYFFRRLALTATGR